MGHTAGAKEEVKRPASFFNSCGRREDARETFCSQEGLKFEIPVVWDDGPMIIMIILNKAHKALQMRQLHNRMVQ